MTPFTKLHPKFTYSTPCHVGVLLDPREPLPLVNILDGTSVLFVKTPVNGSWDLRSIYPFCCFSKKGGNQ